jgi:hypothetical protein
MTNTLTDELMHDCDTVRIPTSPPGIDSTPRSFDYLPIWAAFIVAVVLHVPCQILRVGGLVRRLLNSFKIVATIQD